MMKKFSAQYIFDGKKLLQNAILEVGDDGRIVSLTSDALNTREVNSLQMHSGIILPGLINMHQHLELAALQGAIPQGIGLPDFIKGMADLRSSGTLHDAGLEKSRALDAIMYAQGIQAVLDISNTVDTIEIKKTSQIYYHTMLEIFGVRPVDASTIWSSAQQMLTCFSKSGLAAGISPHSLYALSQLLFNKLQLKPEALYSVHFMESVHEKEWLQKGSGKLGMLLQEKSEVLSQPKFHYLISWLRDIAKASRLVMVHNTCVDREIVELLFDNLNRQELYFCLCPQSNMYIENTLPNLDLLRKSGANIVIGTDSLASNSSTFFIDELKLLQRFNSNLSVVEMLTWSTSNAAGALGLSYLLGSFVPNSKPGVVLLENINLAEMKLTNESRFRRLL